MGRKKKKKDARKKVGKSSSECHAQIPLSGKNRLIEIIEGGVERYFSAIQVQNMWKRSIQILKATPEDKLAESPESEEHKQARILADIYFDKGEEMSYITKYREAYAYYLRGMKVLFKHGKINDQFGTDSEKLRMCQERCALCLWMLAFVESNKVWRSKCLKCYNKLIESDPYFPFWYHRRAYFLMNELRAFKLAYKDFLLFYTLNKLFHPNVSKLEDEEFCLCTHLAMEEVWEAEKEKLRTKKPFLTSDWINMWALCLCGDILLEDMMSVHTEDKSPERKSPLVESAYKDALKQMSRGYHSMVADTLLDGYANQQGIYRAEAYLLLALIYSQVPGHDALHYLDTFILLWETDQLKVSFRRRKLIFMRYMSLARALLRYPFENLDLSMFSSAEQAQFYTQIALTIILRLQLIEGTLDDRREFIHYTSYRLKNIEEACDRAIKADRCSYQCGILREYTLIELAILYDSEEEYGADYELVSYIAAVGDKLDPWQTDFSLWCLTSVYIALKYDDKALETGVQLRDKLLFPGFLMSFFAKMKPPVTNEETVQCIDSMVTELGNDPENFRLHLIVAEYFCRLHAFHEASEWANLALKYWPAHIIHGQVKQLVRNALILEGADSNRQRVQKINDHAQAEMESEDPAFAEYMKQSGRGKSGDGVET